MSDKKGLRLFNWEVIRDSDDQRLHLGTDVPLTIYRAAMYSLHDELSDRLSNEAAQEILRNAGYRVGKTLAESELDLTAQPSAFIAQLQALLKDTRIGILRIEEADAESGKFVLAIDEDVDCSGLPLMEDSVCYYDEGFISGILEAYSGKPYNAKEVDCWTTGARVCRFVAKPKE